MVHFQDSSASATSAAGAAGGKVPVEAHPKTSQVLKQNVSTAAHASSGSAVAVSQTHIADRPTPSDQLPPAPDRPPTIPELLARKAQEIQDCESKIKELSAKTSGLSSKILPGKRDEAKLAKTEIARLQNEVAAKQTEVANLEKMHTRLNDQQEISAIADRLNSNAPERMAKLDEMRGNVQLMLSGGDIPDDMKGKLAPIPLNKSMEEIFRLASTTKIIQGDREVQGFQARCHERGAPVQSEDDKARFGRLVSAYQAHSGDTVKLPSLSNPSEALQFGGSDAARGFNETMTRLVKTSTQTLYTGYLPKEDLLSQFPTKHDESFINGQKMTGSFVPSSQEITRRFNTDGTYEVEVKATLEFKKREKVEGQQFASDRTVATMDVTYTLKFDSAINLTSLQSSAAPPNFTNP